ncbi:MAG: hemerythrin domain-containing protein, partial [Bacteroidales bacterium]|nr:hemerythrin domain-containing protein [Bacteroidales bacterium]
NEVCQHYDVHADFFLQLVNTFHDPSYFPLNELQNFPPGVLVDYLHKTHQFYLEVKIPEIEELIAQLETLSGIDIDHIKLLEDFFRQYKQELTSHINKEEQRVYPYVKALENALFTQNPDMSNCDNCREYSIQQYEDDHDDVESKLFDLKNIIIKYMPAPKDSRMFNIILHELFELEKDLNNHGHIEDLILVPMVERMEKEINQLRAGNTVM